MEVKKTYEFRGTVTIGSDEYRELVWDCATNKVLVEEYQTKYWEAQDKVRELEAKLKGAEGEIDLLLKLSECAGESENA